MEVPSGSDTPTERDDPTASPEEGKISYHGLPHFIPSQNIHIEVVIQYVRIFVDSTALVQNGAYPSCDTVAGFWIASDGDIYLEDAKVMLFDSNTWSEELQNSNFNTEDPLRDQTRNDSNYLLSKTWQKRLAAGRAKRTTNPWPFVMRPRPGFLRYFNSRILAKDLSLLENNHIDVVEHPSSSDSVESEQIDTQISISSSSVPSTTSSNDGNIALRNQRPADVATYTPTRGIDALPSDRSSAKSLQAEQPITHGVLATDNNPIGNGDSDVEHRIVYGNTVVHSGSVQLGNTYHRADTKNDSRSAVVAQNLTSSVIGGGLVYLGFKLAGDTGHSAAGVVSNVTMATTDTIAGSTRNFAVQLLNRFAPPRNVLGNGTTSVAPSHLHQNPSSSRGTVNDVIKSIVWINSSTTPIAPTLPSSETLAPPSYIADNNERNLSDLDEPPPPYEGRSSDGEALVATNSSQRSRVYTIKHISRAYTYKPRAAHTTDIAAHVELNPENCQWLRSDLQSELELSTQSFPKMKVDHHAPTAHDAVIRGDLAAVIGFAEGGADLDERDHENMTPVMIACLTGQRQIVSFLLDRGVEFTSDVKARDLNQGLGFSATLKLALAGKQPEIALQLIEKGARLPRNAWMPDKFLISTSSSSKFKQILGNDPMFPRGPGETASLHRTSVLSVAVMCGEPDLLNVTLDICGDLPEQVDCPLHTAILWPNHEILDILLERTKLHIEPKYLVVDHGHQHFCEPILAVSSKNKSKGLELPIDKDGEEPRIRGLNYYYLDDRLIYVGTLLDVAINLGAADDTFSVVERLLEAGYMFNSKKQDILLGNGVLFRKDQMYETSFREVDSDERNTTSLSELWKGFRSLATG